ncbi:MAG: RNA methyltransferase [Euryarchaeota archaeon]|nr:RNA methyltransferase [Euryarchaeota archaeon]
MPSFRIVLVEPKYEGNVGSVARVMMNFGQSELVLVNPPPLKNEAQARAMHAWGIVENALRVETVAAAIEGCDYVVGTSARIPGPEKTYLRNPIDARDFPPRIAPMNGRVALLFGREDFGLFNEELELCDLLLTIPTSDAYRSLNLAQAIGVVLYEIYVQLAEKPVRELTPMSEEMRRHFQGMFDRLIEAMRMPEHQERNAKTAYRKLFGRAVPSAWEYFVLMGILRRTLVELGVKLPEGRKVPEFDVPPDVSKEFLAMLDPPR